MYKIGFAIPLIATALSFSCTASDVETKTGSQLRVSATLQADVADFAAVQVTLTPSDACGGGSPSTTLTPHELWIDRLYYPDGTDYGEATEYTHAMAEGEFDQLDPGCYEVSLAPVDTDDRWIDACFVRPVPIEIDEHASEVVDIAVECAMEAPRKPLDIDKGNYAPQLLSVTANPAVSACDATVVCATATDPDRDNLLFDWQKPDGLVRPNHTIVGHLANPDGSVTQCIAVQARAPGNYEIGIEVRDGYRELTPDLPGLPPLAIETYTGVESVARGAVDFDATLGCEPEGRSAVILMSLANDPGMDTGTASTLVGNALDWVAPESPRPSLLVVLDDNHRGENLGEPDHIATLAERHGYQVDIMNEPTDGLTSLDSDSYDVVWFVNPGYAMDDPQTHRTLLQWRADGGGLIMSGDDIARFRGDAQFMEPLTYLSYASNGTNACGIRTDGNNGESYTVSFESGGHPRLEGLDGFSFQYGNDIDMTRPLDKGERVLAWASFRTKDCEVRAPAVVALEPDLLLAWD